MPNNAEIAKDTIEQFKKIQDYMVLAKEEHAVKTYDKLKKKTAIKCLSVYSKFEICLDYGKASLKFTE